MLVFCAGVTNDRIARPLGHGPLGNPIVRNGFEAVDMRQGEICSTA